MTPGNFILLITLLFGFSGYCQKPEFIIVPSIILNSNTIPHILLHKVKIFGYNIFKNKREEHQYNRMIRNVKIVYPYAQEVGKKYREYEKAVTLKDDNYKSSMRNLKTESQDTYNSKLKSLTLSQRKIFVKLIDRQTGNSSYDLVKEFKGDFYSFLYQNIARLAGLNLMQKYDFIRVDKRIEIIIRMIKKGVIQYFYSAPLMAISLSK